MMRTHKNWMVTITDMDFAALVNPIHALLVDVGDYLLSVQDTVVREEKGPDDPVSEADRHSQALLKEGLYKILPEATFRGEEAKWQQWNGLAWLVDPLDGTKEYLRGEDEWSTSVALMDGGRPVLGAVMAPALGKFYHGFRGVGAFRNFERVTPSKRSLQAYVLGFSQTPSIIAAHQPELELFTPDRVRHIGSAAYKLCLIADGTLDAYLNVYSERSPCEWDLAGGQVILEAVGGRLTRLSGEPIRYNKVNPSVRDYVATKGGEHEALLAKLRNVRS